MVEVPNRLAIRQNLVEEIQQLRSMQNKLVDSPVTDLEIQPQKVSAIASLTLALEELNPFPRPLLYAGNLLDGAWLLQYSTAREIRTLKSLPLGFLVGKIYQTINLGTASFENKAWVQHFSGLVSGYVKVTATFEPAQERDDFLSDQQINIDFKQRFFGVNQILGIKTNLLDPLRVVAAQNPAGRIPSLNITYIDEMMRIGRGGDGSLFILTKV